MDKKEIMMLKSTDLLQEQQQRHDFGVAVLEGVAVVLVADLGFREGLHRSTGRFHYCRHSSVDLSAPTILPPRV